MWSWAGVGVTGAQLDAKQFNVSSVVVSAYIESSVVSVVVVSACINSSDASGI